MSLPGKLEEVFADATDFELCDALTGATEDRYGFESLLRADAAIPRDRIVIHTVWRNIGLFECEGYSRFWGTKTNHRGFADAMREINLPILASILDDAAALVPADLLGDFDAIDNHAESEVARVQSAGLMDAKLISEHPDIQGRLAAYVRQRRQNFIDLLDNIQTAIVRSRQWRS